MEKPQEFAAGKGTIDFGWGWRDVVERKATFPQNFLSVTLGIPENLGEEVFSCRPGLRYENVPSCLCCSLGVGLGLDCKASESQSRGLWPENSSVPWHSVPAIISV